MSKLKNNQKGFTVVESLLILIILIVIGVVGWAVHKNYHKTNTTDTKGAAISSAVSKNPSASNTPKTTTSPQTNSSSQRSAPSTQVYVSYSANSPYAVLAPATVQSKAHECSDSTTQQVATGINVSLTCSNGDLNVVAWNEILDVEGSTPVMFTLGYNPTSAQVCNAYVDNFVTGTFADEAYQLASQYYGWHFTTDPTEAYVLNGKC